MTSAAAEYERLVASLTAAEGVVAGQMFGKACLKVDGKAFVSLHNEHVVFKLAELHHAKAIGLPGALLWDPSGKGRPMKEWVALPASESKHFEAFSRAALEYVARAK